MDGRYRVTDALLYGIEFYLHTKLDCILKLVNFSTFHREFETSHIWGYYSLLKTWLTIPDQQLHILPVTGSGVLGEIDG